MDMEGLAVFAWNRDLNIGSRTKIKKSMDRALPEESAGNKFSYNEIDQFLAFAAINCIYSEAIRMLRLKGYDITAYDVSGEMFLRINQ